MQTIKEMLRVSTHPIQRNDAFYISIPGSLHYLRHGTEIHTDRPTYYKTKAQAQAVLDAYKDISSDIDPGIIIPSDVSPNSLKAIKDLRDKITSFIEVQNHGYESYREACQELLEITKDW